MNITRTPAVRIRGLRVRRGANEVFDGFDLDIRHGQITGLLGPSGCGKTTLMRAIAGVQNVAGGSVEVLGIPAGSPSLRSRLGYATQAASVYDDLTVLQNARFFARILGVPAADAERVVEAVDLAAQSRARVVDLSGGQRTRVSLAVAMLGSPELLVLDEPTVGLDPVLRESLWSIFRRLADAGTSLVVSSHVMDEAARCDELVLLRDGRLVAQETPAELLTQTGAAGFDAAFLALIEGHAS